VMEFISIGVNVVLQTGSNAVLQTGSNAVLQTGSRTYLSAQRINHCLNKHGSTRDAY